MLSNPSLTSTITMQSSSVTAKHLSVLLTCFRVCQSQFWDKIALQVATWTSNWGLSFRIECLKVGYHTGLSQAASQKNKGLSKSVQMGAVSLKPATFSFLVYPTYPIMSFSVWCPPDLFTLALSCVAFLAFQPAFFVFKVLFPDIWEFVGLEVFLFLWTSQYFGEFCLLMKM